MPTSSFKSGDWKAVCDSCGMTFFASQLKKRWDGFYVCDEDWETRHPQDFLRVKEDDKPLPFVRKDTNWDPAVEVDYVNDPTDNNPLPSGTFGDWS